MPRTKPKPEPASQAQPASVSGNGLSGDVLTLAEAAAYLRITEAQLLQAVRDQALPARQVSREWRFFKTAIQDWLRTGPGPVSAQGNKALLAMAGKFKDDPDLLEICEEAMRRRGRPSTEEGCKG